MGVGALLGAGRAALREPGVSCDSGCAAGAGSRKAPPSPGTRHRRCRAPMAALPPRGGGEVAVREANKPGEGEPPFAIRGRGD